MIPVLCGEKTPQWVKCLNRAAGTLAYQAGPCPGPVAVFTAPQASQLDQIDGLEWAHCTYAGVEAALDLTQTPIARLIDPELGRNMAQSALSACLAYAQNLQHYRQDQRMQRWSPRDQKRPAQIQVLILGAGEMARACAQTLKNHGFKVATFSRRAKALPWPHFSSLGPEVLSGANVLMNLLPSTPDTQGIVNSNLMANLPTDSQIINFGRGDAVVEPDLLNWLEAHAEASALLDVFDIEPLPDSHVYWTHPQVEIWPHVSAQTNVASAAQVIHEAIQHWQQTGQTPALVNRERGY